MTSNLFRPLRRSPRIALAVLAVLSLSVAARAVDKVPLKLVLPKPLFVGTPVPVKLANLEPPRVGKRQDFLVPPGLVNLALNKPVTSSDMEPVVGELAQVTDGEKAGDEGNFVELGRAKQWVQIDLGKPAALYAVAVWHYHSQARVYKGVVVQLSDDSDFIQGVQTIYNSDDRNALGLGAGKDLTYVETNEGRIVDAKGIKARYVRLYSNGNTTSDMNHYTEVEVWGAPAE